LTKEKIKTKKFIDWVRIESDQQFDLPYGDRSCNVFHLIDANYQCIVGKNDVHMEE
jgi:hypothetical protein